MSDPLPGGRRRIDRVLAEDYLEGLESLDLDAVRALREQAVQEEADASYVRRLLHGRMDIIRAELANREGGASGRVVDELAEILADQGPPTGPMRLVPVEPTRVAERRREIEQMLGDVDLADVTSRTDDELRAALERFTIDEERVSRSRHAVQRVVDACNAEIARRYRDGEADVADLLGGPLT
jgi:hypothetical protein